MVSSVRLRPSHYETLGLKPTASDEEIGQAFARKMSMFGAHPMGAAADICIAYETLRNGERRRDYDRSLGLLPEPEPEQREWNFKLPKSRWAPFSAPQQVSLDAERPAPEPYVEAAAVEPEIRRMIAAQTPPARDGHAADWKRPAFAVGGFVVAAGLIGTIAGLSVREDAQSAGAEPVTNVERRAQVPAAALPAVAEARETSATGAVTPARMKSSGRPRLTAWAKRQVRQSQVVGSALARDESEVAPDAETAADPLAPMPAADYPR